MEKLIILKLYGDVDNGFQTVLEIGLEGKRPEVEVRGWLPPPTDLVQYLQQWQSAYRALGQANRILKAKNVKLVGSLNTRKSDCRKSAKQFQQAMNEWLRTESFVAIREKWLEKVPTLETARVMIRADIPQIWQFPWHQWELLDRYPQIEIGFSSLEYEYPTDVESPTQTLLLQILAVLGNAEGINVKEDRQILEQLPGAKTTFLVEPQRRELSEQLWEQRWDILFFAGHSRTEGASGRIYLNQTDSLTLDELKSALRQSVRRGLQLAIFNSCDGLGLALELEQLHIPYMIVMREPVPDRVAQTFLKDFLQIFARGTPFYRAVQQARQRLEGLENEFPCASWLPVIWQNPGATPLTWQNATAVNRHDRPSVSFWHSLKTIIVVSAIAAGSTIGLRLTGLLQTPELWAFDQFMQLRPEEMPDSRLLIVKVTEADLHTYQYPLSDQILAQLLQKLQAAKPQVIGLDILRDRPQQPGHLQLTQQLQQSDRIITICQHSLLDEIGTPPPTGAPLQQIGFNDVVPDPGDVIRRNLLYITPESRSACQTHWAFSTRLALEYLKAKGVMQQETAEGYLQVGAIVFKPLNLPAGGYQQNNFADLAGHQILLNYRRYDGSVNNIAQQVNLTDVLSDRIDPSAIQGRIVLIGVTATSVKDDFNTPYGEKLRGLMIHAQMTSQILTAVLDGRSLLWVWSPWGDWVWIGSWAIVGSFVAWCWRSPTHLILMLGGLLILLSGLCYGIFLLEGWIPLPPAAIALLLSSTGTAIILQSTFHKIENKR